MMERLTIKPGICMMASTEFCESQEDCYLCSHGKKMRFTLSEYEDTGLKPGEVERIKRELEILKNNVVGISELSVSEGVIHSNVAFFPKNKEEQEDKQ